MVVINRILLTLALLLVVAGPAHARRDITYLEKFTMTGEVQDCIRTRNIKESIILDNSTIIFRVTGGKYFVNRLPVRCGGLRMRGGFTYSTHGSSRLCHVDIITGTHPCSLGKFERIEKKPKE